MRTGIHVTLLSVLVALLAACAPTAGQGVGGVSPESKPLAPKTIVAVISGVPPGLDNRFIVSSNNAGYVELANLYSSKLIVADDAAVMIPQLAENAPSLENGL